MGFKVGDKVLVKDLDWYNKNKDKNDEVMFSTLGPVFTRRHSKYAGKVMTVGIVSKLGFYVLKEDKEGNLWYDEMFDTLVEEEIQPKFKVGDKITNGEITFTILTLSSDRYGAEDTFGECGSVCFKSQDEWEIVEEEMKSEDGLLDEYEELTDRAFKGGYEKCKSDIELNGFQLPEGYQFVDENGNVINATKIVLEKKKKEYPKTYVECYSVLGYVPDEDVVSCYRGKLIESFVKLLICRDAYWKIAGEEMGLGKSWEPDWENYDDFKFVIGVNENKIIKCYNTIAQFVFAFPTEEMRDAFYEAFQKEIEICKELL